VLDILTQGKTERGGKWVQGLHLCVYKMEATHHTYGKTKRTVGCRSTNYLQILYNT